MKIIGKTSQHFLVEASEAELAQLCGYLDSWYMPDKGREVIKPGVEINITAMFAALNELTMHYNKIVAAQASLRAAADALNFPLPVVGEISKAIEQYRPAR